MIKIIKDYEEIMQIAQMYFESCKNIYKILI